MEVKAVECFHCKGTLQRRSVSYSASRNGYHLIVDNVPAWVCDQCDEPLFDESTVDSIQDALRAVDARLEQLTRSSLAA